MISPEKKGQIEAFAKQIGYDFKNQEHLILALSHRSFHAQNNERLEFLGDGILNFVVALLLYQKYPYAKEGDLTRMRAFVVNGESLAKAAKALDFSDALLLGPGEMKSGGSSRASILENAFEALVAAVYLDSDIQTVTACIEKWLNTALDACYKGHDTRDSKTLLQEKLQSVSKGLPSYKLLKTTGEPHCQTFYVECYLEHLDITTNGTGSSRKQAEQQAAQLALEAYDAQQKK